MFLGIYATLLAFSILSFSIFTYTASNTPITVTTILSKTTFIGPFTAPPTLIK